MKKKICVITGSRAEYGLLKFLIKKLKASKSLVTSLVITGTHLSKEHGYTSKEILNDNLKIDKKIFLEFKNDKKIDISNSTALSINKFSEYFSKNKFDLVIINGDRYEIFGAAIASYFFNIKIAHFHGGELTEGLIDEGIRHSITKMSHYHFVSTTRYKKRIQQLGENKNNIFFVGALSLDNILKYKYLSREKLEKKLKFQFKSINFIFTYHPLTLESEKTSYEISIILKALDQFSNCGIIFTKSNADVNNKIITKQIDKYVKKNNKRCIAYNSLGSFLYFSVLNNVNCVIGNSSSGIIEAPSFNIPTVNIGNRQSGREKSKSIIDVKCKKKDITEGIKKSINPKFLKKIKPISNPYFRKNTISECFKIIKNINKNDDIKKKFKDII